MPGPCCIVKTPILSPEVTRLTASAMCRPDPLLADDDRADIRLGGRLDDRVDRIADQELDPLALEHLGDGRTTFMAFPLCLLLAARDDRSPRL